MTEINVMNKTSYTGDGEYIGRPSPLGNPFKIGKDGTREETIQKYRIWLWKQIQQQTPAYDEFIRLARLATNEPVTLVCWCTPQPCHADVIKNALIWWIWNQEPRDRLIATLQKHNVIPPPNASIQELEIAWGKVQSASMVEMNWEKLSKPDYVTICNS